jgi:hypothetical protein
LTFSTGDDETAKKYLIEYKKLGQTIASAESDLTTDMNQVCDFLPLIIEIKTFLQARESPNQDYDMVRDDELTDEISQSNPENIYHRLQEDLLRQMQLCARNQQMYAQMEGLNNKKQANDFKMLEQRSAQDLERLKQNARHGSKAPIFHYEKRQMNIIQVNNDLTDNDLEVKSNDHACSFIDLFTFTFILFFPGHCSSWYQFTSTTWLFINES